MDCSSDRVDACSSPVPAEGGGAAPPEAGDNLDKSTNTVRFLCKGCGLSFCRRCRGEVAKLRKGWLRAATAGWKSCVLLTLTVDRHGTETGKGFADPAEAFDYVQGRRLVSRLLRGRRYVVVIEFQEAGWPHWHVLVDGWIDGDRVWRLWRDRWKVGRPHFEWVPLGAGVNYLCKYVSKGGDAPAWVLERTHFRMISSGGGVVGYAAYLDSLRRGERVRSEEEREVERAGARSIAVRLEGCGRECVAIVCEVDAEGKVVRSGFRGAVKAPWRSVRELAFRLGMGVRVENDRKVLAWERVDDGGGGFVWRPKVSRACGLRFLEFDADDGLELLRRLRRAA